MRNIRKKKRVLYNPVFMLAMFSIAALIGLGCIRSKVTFLERELREVNSEIKYYSEEEMKLDSALRGLISPIKIYGYCKDRLGMYAARPEVVNLPRVFTADAGTSETKQGWRSTLFAFFGLALN